LKEAVMKKGRLVLLALMALIAAMAAISPAFADGVIIPRPIPGKPVPPYLNVRYHHVKTVINNQVATTEVDQEFENRLNRDLEGDYIFPLPEDAAISSFQMEVDGKMVEGKVLDRDEARKIYEDIVRKRMDPALLEYVGRNMFRARVYPIPAHGTKRIRIKYSETLKAENGVVKYHYPLDTERFSPEPLKDVSLAVEVESKVPIKAIYSPSHNMIFHRISDHRVKGSFEKSNYTPDKDLILYYTLSDRDFGLSLLTHREKGDNEGYFLMFIAPRQKAAKEEILPKDVVFVLDRSGSMDDKGKMENAKKALNFCLANLNRADTFNVVIFSDEVESFAEGLVPATPEAVKKARAFADKVTPLGGTNIRDALLKAIESFKGSQNTKYIVFLTDGLPTVGETDVAVIQKDVAGANKKGIRLFPFGVGYDVNTRLLDGLAKDNRGYPEYIKPEEDMEVKVTGFYRKIAEPLLSDVTLSISGVKTFSLYPGEMPDIFQGSQLMVVGKYSGAGPCAVKLSGRRGRAALAQTYESTFAQVEERNDFIPRIWAMRRIGYLLEAIRQKGENKELVEEVVRLSKKFGIITPYTSFLVTEPTSGERSKYEGRPAPVQSAPAGPVFRGGAAKDTGEESVNTSQDIAKYKQAKEPVAQDQKVMNIEGKTFFLRDGIWTDSEYAGTEKLTKVKLGSKEYFELAGDKKSARFLSVGSRVLLKYKGVTYLIEP
jgi:Ca-activated chloride channel family protein